MTTRLRLIIAHLQSRHVLTAVEVSAHSIVAQLMHAGEGRVPARETKFKIDAPGMNETLAKKVVDKLAMTIHKSVYILGPSKQQRRSKGSPGITQYGLSSSFSVYSLLCTLQSYMRLDLA